jgi:hypothetical protein
MEAKQSNRWIYLYKATASKASATDFRNFRPKKKEADKRNLKRLLPIRKPTLWMIELPKEITITAWYY